MNLKTFGMYTKYKYKADSQNRRKIKHSMKQES